MTYSFMDWNLIDFNLIDIGLIMYIISFLPSRECCKCASNIGYWDESYLTIPKMINGEIKNLIYCSQKCANNT